MAQGTLTGSGPRGPRGQQGAAGSQGQQGFGVLGFDGEPGPEGPEGMPGNAGATGATGATGAAGADGVAGAAGPPGMDGEDAPEPLVIPGPIGPTGFDGALLGYRLMFAGLTDPAGTTLLQLLSAITATGTTSNHQDAPDAFINYNSAASSGANAGWSEGTVGMIQYVRAPIFETWIKTGGNVSDPRYWVGLFSGDPRAAANPAALHLAGFRYEPGTDTNWQACTKDGTTLSTTDTGVAVAINTKHRMVIDMRNSTFIKFYIDDVLVATKTTNLPGSTTSLFRYIGLQNTAANARAFRIQQSLVWVK